MSTHERLWSVQDLANFVGVPVQSVYEWRCKGYGPPSMKIGRYVRYRAEDVMDWVDEKRSEAA